MENNSKGTQPVQQKTGQPINRQGQQPKRPPNQNGVPPVRPTGQSPNGGARPPARPLEKPQPEVVPPKEPLSKKKIILTVLSIVAVIGISVPLIVMYIGASIVKKDSVVVSLKAQIEGLNEEIEELESAVADTTVQEVIRETSLQTIEGSLVPEFKLLDDKIVFPNKLELPDSDDDINNSNIMLGSKFKFVPSNNWIIKMQGATLNLSHPSDISGVMRSVAIKEPLTDEDIMKELIQNFFIGFPATTIQYRKVFIGDRVGGMQGSATITVDGKENCVIVGFVQRSENAILYLFDYIDNKSSVQTELIDLFINSGSSGDSKVILE